MGTITFECQNCGASVTRPIGDEGYAKFCSRRCSVIAQPRPSREERFWPKVDKSGECWVWTGWKTRLGYGIIQTGSRGHHVREQAHRVSWEIANGPIPDGLWILHRCDNPPCVRPTHLYAGTPADNVNDRQARGRHRVLKGDDHPQRQDPSKVLRGEQHGRAKLTEEDVRIIRTRRAAGEPLNAIAIDYGVRVAAIWSIANRRNWKHVK